jgi:lipopolysaccharide biosynthesis glycosyltransferase
MNHRTIAMAFDDNYVFPALVAIFSGRKHFGGVMRVIVGFDPNTLSLESRSILDQVSKELSIVVNFLEIKVPDYLSGVGHISKMSWARMMLIDQIDEDFVWLDSDVILQPGWDRILSDSSFASSSGLAAALDMGVGNLSAENAARVVSGDFYINAGVLVVKPFLIKQEMHLAFHSAMHRYSELGLQWMDQDVLNYCYRGTSDIIPEEFNVQVPISRLRKVPGRIFHFSTDAKPWLGAYRLAFFWSFSVRKWNRLARLLCKRSYSDGTVSLKLRELRRKAALFEHGGFQRSGVKKKLSAFAARLIWGQKFLS